VVEDFLKLACRSAAFASRQVGLAARVHRIEEVLVAFSKGEPRSEGDETVCSLSKAPAGLPSMSASRASMVGSQ
jgi:hypothetical protein